MSDGGSNFFSAVGMGTDKTAPTTPGAEYTPAQQGPTYQPQYQQYMPQQLPNYQSGLRAAMEHMMQQYSQPTMRAPVQQGLVPSSPLTYRPTMSTDNLKRVAPSVELQQKQAAEEARKQAEADSRWGAEHPAPLVPTD